MFRMDEDEGALSFVFSSQMHLVDRVIQSARAFLSGLGIHHHSEFRLVLRELLINAVEHGNKNIAEKQVVVKIISLENRNFRIDVEDEGEGFDYTSLNMQIPQDASQMRKRGYPMVKAFTDSIQWDKNGKHVTVWISIPNQTRFTVEEKNGISRIIPSGDITAATADGFRFVLVELLDKGKTRFVFDFAHVEDIDSVALSVMIIFSKMLMNRSDEWELSIENAGEGIRQLFKLTRMDRSFAIKEKE